MADTGTDFSWTDTDSVVVRQQAAVAVYENPDGDVVIRRQRDWNENEDVFVVIPRDQVRTVIKAIERVRSNETADAK
jgi:hypothetical protein